MTRTREWISVNDAAQIAGCTSQTIRRAAHAHELDGYRLSDSGWMRIARRSFDAWLKARIKANFHGGKNVKTNGRKR
jgi:excisionase family DNA binding protein